MNPRPGFLVALAVVLVLLIQFGISGCATHAVPHFGKTGPVDPNEFTWAGLIMWVGPKGGILEHQVGYAISHDECDKMIARELAKGPPPSVPAGTHPAVSCLDSSGKSSSANVLPPQSTDPLHPSSPNGPGTGVTEL